MKQLFKYRALCGMVPYDVVKDNKNRTLVLQDTSCKGHTPCLIQVKEDKENDCFIFDTTLNIGAKEYEYYHTGEGFYTTKEKSIINQLETMIVNNNRQCSILNDTLFELSSQLQTVGEINYLTKDKVDYEDTVYSCATFEDTFKIVGTISMKDGSTMYLTDNTDILTIDENGFVLFDGSPLFTDRESATLEETKRENIRIDNRMKKIKSDIDERLNKNKKYLEIISLAKSENLPYDEIYKQLKTNLKHKTL